MSTDTAVPPSPVELVTGLVERVTFHNSETGFSVLRVKARGFRDLITVVGHAAAISPGEFIHATGSWLNDRVHGVQFKAAHLQTTPPTTLEGIEKYLGSGLIRGIGPHFAKKLVTVFGEHVFDVIDHEPDRLREIDGIGPVRARRVTEGWTDQKVIREIMVFLHSHGVGTTRAVRIFKTYGAEAVAIISQNPYRLAADIRGIGFVTADQIAGRLGIEKTSPLRVRAGIGYTLFQALDDGHCGLPREDLEHRTATLLEIPWPLVPPALDAELETESVTADSVGGRACVFLTWLYVAERNIGARIRQLAQGTPPWAAIDADKAVPWAEQRLNMTLATGQADALRRVLGGKFTVITGGPGVGKTTLMQALLTILGAKRVRTALCAPTGRAAKRLSEATGLAAKTVHRLLEVSPHDGGFRRSEANPLECDLLVVDETSMVDVPLMHALMRAVPPRAAVVLVGDVDQLPSVGPGQVLGDIIASGSVPVMRLTEVFRQARQSRIILNAHRINQGLMPDLTPDDALSDFYFVDAEDPEDGVRKVLQLVADRIPQRFGLDPIRQIQVLCPMNRGGLGTRSLNIELQTLLNPPHGTRIDRFGTSYGIGDKVMQIENDYERDVYNGDVGFVTAIDPDLGQMVVDFDGRSVRVDFDDLDRMVLAYATTIHKAQGSEYPAVVIPVMTQHYPMLRRNLIYTGVTRGKRLVVLVGQRRALGIAVRGQQVGQRWSKLKEWLMGGVR